MRPSVAVTIVASAAPAVLAQGCPPLELVYARATTEPPTGVDNADAAGFETAAKKTWSKGYGAAGYSIFTNMTALIPGSTGYPVHYPASFQGGMSGENSSPGKGIKDMVAHIQAMAKKCPETKFALGGHSQGGVVTVQAIPKMGEDVLKRVVAVTMVGSPPCPKQVADRCKSFCNKGDSICEGGGGGMKGAGGAPGAPGAGGAPKGGAKGAKGPGAAGGMPKMDGAGGMPKMDGAGGMPKMGGAGGMPKMGGAGGPPKMGGADAAPKPEKADTPPKPEMADAAPMPEKTDAAPKPEKADAGPKPEKADAAPKPEKADAPPKPEKADTAPKPAKADAAPKPEKADAAPKPEKADAAPKPAKADAAPQPAKADSGMMNMAGMAHSHGAHRRSPTPDVAAPAADSCEPKGGEKGHNAGGSAHMAYNKDGTYVKAAAQYIKCKFDASKGVA